MVKRNTTILKILFSVLIMALLIVSADKVRAACFDALLLCGRLIIPSLFPFFVLCTFITKLGLPGTLGKIISPLASGLYGISPAGSSALMLGLVGGYPSGAAYIANMQKEGLIKTEEGERLLAFCNNSGPAFIIGVMGSGIFGSVTTGLQLYAVHIVSALLTGLFFRSRNHSKLIAPHRLEETDTAQAIVDSIKQAVSSMLNVCGFVITFSVLLSLLDLGGFFSIICYKFSFITGKPLNFFKTIFTGILELGSAAGCMAGFEANSLNLALTASILSWGGLSVHFQTLAVLSDSKIKGSLHLAGRLISAIIAFILMYFVSLL